MIGTTATEIKTQPTVWDCCHMWVDTVQSKAFWISPQTCEHPPTGAPVYSQRKCLKCGAVEWHSVGTNN